MHYTNSPKLNSSRSPGLNTESQTLVSPDEFSLFNALHAMDDIQFRTTLDDFYASLPAYWLTDAGPPVSEASDRPGLSLSMGLSGELTVPEIPSYESFNNKFNLSPSYSQCVDLSPFDPCIMSQDNSMAPIAYHDLTCIGEITSSSYNTEWELDKHLHSNFQYILQKDHAIETGTLNHSLPLSDMMQQSQKLDILSASRYTYTGFSPGNSGYHNPYTLYAEDIQQEDCTTPSSPLPFPTPAPSWPTLDTTLYPNHHPALSCSPASLQSPEPSLSPSSSLIDTPSSSLPVTPYWSLPAHSPPSPAPIYPTSSQYQTPVKKRARISKKIAPGSSAAPPKVRGVKRFPGGRAPIRSQYWLSIYFPNKGSCIICGGGPSSYRADRALEHLVSSHIFQVVKNLDIFDAERLQEEMPFHLFRNNQQFKFARKWIHSLKCSLCPRETSLVVREENIKRHLDAVHSQNPPEARSAELERIKGLTGDRKAWYSFHDEFLFEFSSLEQS